MGQTISEPITTKETSRLEDPRFVLGCSSMQGWRVNMEDYHTLLLDMDSGKSFFAVFDGHGGKTVAKMASDSLHHYIMDSQHYKEGDYVNAITDGFLTLDRYLHVTYGESLAKLSGSTAVCLLIADGMVYCGNLGDSRAVACVDRECVQLSFDHKPDNENEANRIKLAGGYIEGNRVNGNLALSRAFGDFHYKSNQTMPPSEQMVSPCPDIESIEFNDKLDFLFLACDGIWDVLSNEELVDFVSDRIEEMIEPHIICEQLMSLCLAPDFTSPVGCDNMTCVLICYVNGMSYKDYCSRFASRATQGRVRQQKFSPKTYEEESPIAHNTMTHDNILLHDNPTHEEVDDFLTPSCDKEIVEESQNGDDTNANVDPDVNTNVLVSEETAKSCQKTDFVSMTRQQDDHLDKVGHPNDQHSEQNVSEPKASQNDLDQTKDSESTNDDEKSLDTSNRDKKEE